MENRKNKFMLIAVILTLTVLNGCRITTIRNQYYNCPDENQKSKDIKAGSKNASDTLIINKNGEN